jgi:hypothetical protein
MKVLLKRSKKNDGNFVNGGEKEREREGNEIKVK